MADVAADPTAEATPTGTSGPEPHIVKVGPGDHRFHPEIVKAKIGDTIHFEFFPKNHSVIRSTYESPCVPYEMMVTLSKQDYQGSIYSFFKPVYEVKEDWEMPWHNITLKDDEPIYIYCGAPGSCRESGMVMIINPDEEHGMVGFRRNALDSGYQIVPGEAFPEEGTSVPKPESVPTSTATSESTPSETAAQSTTSAAAAAATAHHATMSTGAIAGVAIGGAATLAIIGILLFLMFSRKQKKQERMIASAVPPDSNQYGGASPTFTGPAGQQQQPQTIIIPMTESEKAMYLERLSTQWRGNNVSPVNANDIQQDQTYRMGTVSSTMTGISGNTGERTSTVVGGGGGGRFREYGTPQSPAEMDPQAGGYEYRREADGTEWIGHPQYPQQPQHPQQPQYPQHPQQPHYHQHPQPLRAGAGGPRDPEA